MAFVYERSGFFSGEKKKKLMLNERTVSETICFLASEFRMKSFLDKGGRSSPMSGGSLYASLPIFGLVEGSLIFVLRC